MANGRALPVNTDVTLFTAETFADDTGYLRVVEEGRGNVWEKISFGNLLANGRNIWTYPVRSAPYMIDAALFGDLHESSGTGSVYLDISNIAFYQRYSFQANSLCSIYLDPGRFGLFLGWGTNGQMLKLDPYAAVDIRRTSNNIFTVIGPTTPPAGGGSGSVPVVQVSASGTYTLPTGGGGSEYQNTSGGGVTFLMTSMSLQAVYWVSNNSTQTSTIDPGIAPGVILGLNAATTVNIGPGVKIPISRLSTNIYVIGTGTAGLVNTTGFTVAGLPILRYVGMLSYATDGRKPGEGAGAGTGVPVFWDGTGSWKSSVDGAAVVA